MKIYSMTATFGSLENRTLTLQPGLNVIEAPNEWGKSTWCAFLVTMLYGIETRVKTTKTALADKERYAPWSGSPMAGRIDLDWNGRNITIERWTKGRIPMGEFRAYETETGLAVPELTGLNCGQMLLGVEKSVFTRAGFLKLTDLPVTQDESLRRRLNALVTTGDESGAADDLARKLRDLKNKCRHNRTGLLPQAEGELAALEGKKAELSNLTLRCGQLRDRQDQVALQLKQLHNHRDALLFDAAQADASRVALAVDARNAARQTMEAAEEACKNLPNQEEALQALRVINSAMQERDAVQMESQMLPLPPEMPTVPEPFRGMNPEQAAKRAADDREKLGELQQQTEKTGPWLWILGAALIAAGIGCRLLSVPYGWLAVIPGGICLIAGLMLQISSNRRQKAALTAIDTLTTHYGSCDPDKWEQLAREYRDASDSYEQALRQHRQVREDLDQRRTALADRINKLCVRGSMEDTVKYWNDVIAAWKVYEDAHRDHRRSEEHVRILESMAKTARPPAFEDHLTCTEAETAGLLRQAELEQQELQRQFGQCQGRMEAIGQESRLDAEISALKQRIGKLEDTYAALEYAQAALATATTELQRRFAPKIAARAQDLFSRLTDGRYQKLLLGEDLSLSACTPEETTLRSAQWRSDGTADQLYLALRLAVAQELTPDAPLILDDALVRFDDTRLKAALKILREESEQKQVILFTCQDREKRLTAE